MEWWSWMKLNDCYPPNQHTHTHTHPHTEDPASVCALNWSVEMTFVHIWKLWKHNPSCKGKHLEACFGPAEGARALFNPFGGTVLKTASTCHSLISGQTGSREEASRWCWMLVLALRISPLRGLGPGRVPPSCLACWRCWKAVPETTSTCTASVCGI